jgi:hypothetical protein
MRVMYAGCGACAAALHTFSIVAPRNPHSFTHSIRFHSIQALAVNEFHDFPLDFTFTAPIPSSALPPLRISGDGVLKEFGFECVTGWLPWGVRLVDGLT